MAVQTIVLSDLHLADAEAVDLSRPMWKAFKRREYFVDADVAALLRHSADGAEAAGDTLEVVFNGDVFDFDPILRMPDPPPSPIHWLSRLRGLGTEQWMSSFKIGLIIDDHPEFFRVCGEMAQRGHQVVFVMGNHDLELAWPQVQDKIRLALTISQNKQHNVRFCEWFYLSGADTLITHGHVFDSYCTVPDLINPLISVRGKARVRLPFGEVANRFMLNGMGFFNPHATANYIMSAKQYVRFFFKYMVRSQPLLLWTWFWSALATLLITFADFLRPALRDPLTVEDKVAAIAERARATPAMVRQLAAAAVPSACTNPLAIVRELWLDRALLFMAMVYAAFQFVVWINFVWPISPLWTLLPLSMLFPLFLSYSFKVKPETFVKPLIDSNRAEWIARITGAKYAVVGHTHLPELQRIGPLYVCNAGFWSPAFAEPDCKARLGTQSYARIAAAGDGSDSGRELQLWEWPPGADRPKPLNLPPRATPSGSFLAVVAQVARAATTRKSKAVRGE